MAAETVRFDPVGARSGDRENCKCNIAKRQSTFCLANDDGKLPDGQITKNLSSPFRKNIFA
jgi:hypothetical protein